MSRAHRKPAALRLARSALGLVATTAVTVLLTLWLEDMFAPAPSMGIDVAPEPSALPYALITAGLVALAWTIARARSARVARWPDWPMYAGPLIGVAVALLVLD